MEKHTVSRELAQKLKDAGYPQNESQFVLYQYWADSALPWKLELRERLNFDGLSVIKNFLAMPLSDELLEQLPKMIDGASLMIEAVGSGWYSSDGKTQSDWYVGYYGGQHDTQEYDWIYYFDTKLGRGGPRIRRIDALAELWLYCKANGHIEPKGSEE